MKGGGLEGGPGGAGVALKGSRCVCGGPGVGVGEP